MANNTIAANGAAIELYEFKKGWHILFLALMGTATGAAVVPLYAFGPMIIPLQEHFGWGRGEIQAAITFFGLGLIFSNHFAGWLNSRFGERPVTLVSLVLMSCGFISMALISSSIWGLYFGFAAITFLGAGTLQITWTHLINLWFIKNRGLALAIILCGTGVAALIFPPLISHVVGFWGWQAGFIAMGAVPLLFTLPLSFGLLHFNRGVISGSDEVDAVDHRSHGASYSEAIRGKIYWRMTIGLLLVVAAVLGFVTNGVPMLVDAGFSGATASYIFSFFGASLIVSRLLVGYLIDRLWAPGVAFFALSIPAVGCLLFLFANNSLPLMILGAILVGAGAGAEYDIAAFLVSRYFGLKDYPKLFGLQLAVIAVGICGAPLLFAVLYEYTSTYTSMLISCAAFFMVGSLLLLTLGRYPKYS